MDEHNIKNTYQNMTVKDLKLILSDLPDDMHIVIPVIDAFYANHIYGFRYVRTAGELISECEQDREVFCLNAAADGQDIEDQVHYSDVDVHVDKILFGMSKNKKENAEIITEKVDDLNED